MRTEIDPEFGVPVEEITCPACGRTYKRARTVCSTCEECKRCCQHYGQCESPNYLPAREFIRQLLMERI